MLKSIMRWVYQYDVAAFFISLVVLYNLFISQRIKSRVSKAFKVLAIDLFFATIFDVLTIFTISYYELCPVWLNYLLNILALLTYNSLPAFYITSIMYGSLSEEQDFTIGQKLLIAIPVCAAGFLIITTPLTKAIIYFTQDGQYKIGSTFDILTAIGFIYLIMVVVYGISKRKTLRTEQTITIILYTICTIAALVITNIWTKQLVSLFSASLTVLITYLSLDNPSEYKDPIMDIYNKKAFMFTTSEYFNSRKKFTVLGIHIEGITFLNETLGYNNFNRVLVTIARKICGICGKNNVYRLSGSKLAIIIHKDDKNKDDKYLELQLLFSQSLKVTGIEVSPKVKMATFECPEAADNFVKLNDMIFDTLNSNETETGKIIDGNKQMLEKSRREYQLVHILKQSLSSNQFEVFYQPIYSVKKKKFTTAEALIRLTNEELGFVSPDEFIPIAERNGLILLIGEFVFRSVCKFILNNKLWEKGIEYIHVNLSAIQCMQEKLHEQLLSIMDYYGLDYKYIELEVTETAAIASSDTLLKNMKQLMEKNMNFALDDYGMGYSNTSSILQYPFHTIKLDKSIVWSAVKNEKARKLLQHTIAMFRDMGIELVAEGVETSEMAVMLMKMKCDYLQGFLYSKPVKAKEFLELLAQF
jgi:EAL domain-containing protein (putative c-di-GMP-specific phosphodiesterase class I)/GGDEF domain-containing protein